MQREIQEAARAVHAELGPGYTETIYHSALQRELSERGIAHHSEGTVPVMYKSAPVGRRRPDMFIIAENGDTVIVEMKAGSSSGKGQLVQYLDLVMADENYGQIIGGAVIRFNEDLEFEYATVNHDTTEQEDLQTFKDNS
jgi:GxxExxY protein